MGQHEGGRAPRWTAKANTAPEVLLRQAVHAAGGRFRLHRRIAKGCTPDFVLPSRRVAVFVDGCFWHGCPEHGRKTPWTGPNARPLGRQDAPQRGARPPVHAAGTGSRMARREGVGVPGAPGPRRSSPRGHESTGAPTADLVSTACRTLLMEYHLRGDASPLAHRVDPVGCARPEDSPSHERRPASPLQSVRAGA